MPLTPERVNELRHQFPALSKVHSNGQPVVFLDGPAGTQVHQSVIDAMTRYLVQCNANKCGVFETSVNSDRWMNDAHRAMAEFVGGDDPGEIVFGQNMTSLTFALARSLSKTWNRGDEVVVTRLDHDANITPWVTAANDVGVTVKYVDFDPQKECQLDLDQLKSYLGPRTRLVAVGCASNATGGINPVKRIGQMAHDCGSLVFLDAVHYAPHGLIDVTDWNCDFLACSAYKFFGPHLGILWGRRELLESLFAYQVRPAPSTIPDKWMTGTQSHESIAGGMACVDYLADLGRQLAGQPNLSRRDALRSAYGEIGPYEKQLAVAMLQGLSDIDGIAIHGVSHVEKIDERFSTFSVTHRSISTRQLARQLADERIYVWDGNYYALQFTEHLGLEPEGMVRIGLVHYNTQQEVQRLLEAVERSVRQPMAT